MKFLGVTDEITTCEHCGKTNLKRTIAIRTDTGAIVHYGCDCAARALQNTNTNKGVSANGRDVNQIADLMAYAQKWIQTRDIKAVARGIWERFGYSAEIRNEVIRVKTMAGIIEFERKL